MLQKQAQGPGRACLSELDLVDQGPQRNEAVLLPLPLPLAADLQTRACAAHN